MMASAAFAEEAAAAPEPGMTEHGRELQDMRCFRGQMYVYMRGRPYKPTGRRCEEPKAPIMLDPRARGKMAPKEPEEPEEQEEEQIMGPVIMDGNLKMIKEAPRGKPIPLPPRPTPKPTPKPPTSKPPTSWPPHNDPFPPVLDPRALPPGGGKVLPPWTEPLPPTGTPTSTAT